VRAIEPDENGFARGAYWERFGEGDPTLLFVPAWAIVHSRIWKMQVPYFARHFRVVAFDPRGNGRSARPDGPAAYAESEYVEDMLAVMDASGTERAVLVSLSLGAERSLLFADEHPERVLGLVFIAPALPLVPLPTRGRYIDQFSQELDSDEGWAKYNAHYWRRDYRGFLEFFFSQAFPERHSTKQIEDAVAWGLETDAETLIATSLAEGIDEQATREMATRIECPVLVIHGEDDAIRPIAGAAELAALTGARFVRMPGVGHCPQARKPVAVNLALREFLEAAVRAPPALATGNPSKGGLEWPRLNQP
jgi:pimeloyl-ACP methyl ester carboxylesterase